MCVHTFKHEYLKFYLKHHWGGGKAALGFGPDRFGTLVSMVTDGKCCEHSSAFIFDQIFFILADKETGISRTQDPASRDEKIGLERMVLLRDDCTDARFFRHEASRNIGFDVYYSHCVFGDIARQLFPIIGV